MTWNGLCPVISVSPDSNVLIRRGDEYYGFPVVRPDPSVDSRTGQKCHDTLSTYFKLSMDRVMYKLC